MQCVISAGGGGGGGPGGGWAGARGARGGRIDRLVDAYEFKRLVSYRVGIPIVSYRLVLLRFV